ncbi:MAG: alpha/beta hydrolase [Erysipelotrichaceae bacterium]
MNVTMRMIDKELRVMGLKYRFVHFKDEQSMRKASIQGRALAKGATSKHIDCEEMTITTRLGNELRLCLYRAKQNQENAIGFLWLHGGGYALGLPETDLMYYEHFINTENCVIVAPDYRLSVEAPYPAALEDAYEALVWMKEHAKELGINPDQLFVGGNSAGGGLTASLTLYARDKGEVKVAFQMPLYPMLDDRMQTHSMINNNAPVWNERSNAIAWKLYLGDAFGSDAVSKYAAPARESDFRALPPTYTFVGDIEPFYDETVQYVEQLKKARVPVRMDVYEKCYHAFDSHAPKTKISKKAIEKLLEEFRYAAKHYVAQQTKQ